jgi:hypothetical protein
MQPKQPAVADDHLQQLRTRQATRLRQQQTHHSAVTDD